MIAFTAQWRRLAANEPLRALAGTVAVWLVYVLLVEAIAHATLRDAGHPLSPGAAGLLHGFVDDLAGAPPLARWDSIWFYGIAAEGYSGTGPQSPSTAGFLPLYPLLMRGVAAMFQTDYFRAGLWVSRLALLAALLLLRVYIHDRAVAEEDERAARLALLCFPTAFILVSVYTEALFLSLALAALVLARRDRCLAAAVAACLAGLTRIHGLALVPALAVWGWQCWRGGRRSLAVWLPMIGAATAYVALAAYFWAKFDDPLRYLHAKQGHWNLKLAAPWTTIDQAIGQTERALADGNLGSLATGLELPCLYLIVLAIGLLCVERAWPEVVYATVCLSLSLVSGSLWGLPRFTLVVFPVFAVLSRLPRWPAVWHAYLLACALVQGALLINFVTFSRPAP